MSNKKLKDYNNDTVLKHIRQSFLDPKFLDWGSLKKLRICFTKLHIYCYNNTHNKQFLLIMTPEAERFNGWAAMLGFVAAVGAYVTTGQIIPGWF